MQQAQITMFCIVADDCKNDLTNLFQQYYLGHKVLFANDGSKAASCIEQLDLDIIVIDLDIPEYDYTSIYKAIKLKTKTSPIIPLSARITDQVIDKCNLMGVDYCLSKKPFNQEVIRIKLDLAVNTLSMGTENDMFDKARSKFFT